MSRRTWGGEDRGKLARGSFEEREDEAIDTKDANSLHVGICRSSDANYEIEAAGGASRGFRLLARAVLRRAVVDALRVRSGKVKRSTSTRKIGPWRGCDGNVYTRCAPMDPMHAEAWLRETMVGDEVGTSGGYCALVGADAKATIPKALKLIEQGMPVTLETVW